MNKKTMFMALLGGLLLATQPAARAAGKDSKDINLYAAIDAIPGKLFGAGKFGYQAAKGNVLLTYNTLRLALKGLNTYPGVLMMGGVIAHQKLVRLIAAKPAIMTFLSQAPGLRNFVDYLKTTNQFYLFVNNLPSLVLTALRTTPQRFMELSFSQKSLLIMAVIVVGKISEIMHRKEVAKPQDAKKATTPPAITTVADPKVTALITQANAHEKEQEKRYQALLSKQQQDQTRQRLQKEADFNFDKRKGLLEWQAEDAEKQANKARQDRENHAAYLRHTEQLQKNTEGVAKAVAHDQHQARMNAAVQAEQQQKNKLRQDAAAAMAPAPVPASVWHSALRYSLLPIGMIGAVLHYKGYKPSLADLKSINFSSAVDAAKKAKNFITPVLKNGLDAIKARLTNTGVFQHNPLDWTYLTI